MVRLKGAQIVEPLRAHGERILLQVFVAKDIEHGQTGGACHGIPAKGAEKFHTIGEGGGNFARGDDRRERKGIADGFAKDGNVWHDSLRFESPEMRAQAAEAHLYFIGDGDGASSAHQLIDLRQVLGWKHNLSADTWQSFR